MHTLSFYRSRRRLPAIIGSRRLHDFRWRLTASNGRTVGASTQGYSRAADCMTNAMEVTHYDDRDDIVVVDET